MFSYRFADHVNLAESFLDGIRSSYIAWQKNREENGVHSAFLHPRNVDTAKVVARAEIIRWIQHQLRGVVVGIENNGRKVQRLGTIRHAISGHGCSARE